MTTVQNFHASFSAALIDPDPAVCPPGLDRHQARRFMVYRNNVQRGLSEALGAAYPVVKRLTGEDFFAAMARLFAAGEPQRPASMALHGAGFAEFIDAFPPAAGIAYLSDIARLERAWLEAYHAADHAPLQAADLAGLGDELETAHFTPHPAARLVVSQYPIYDIWRANAPGGTGGGEILARAQTVLVTRPELEVAVSEIAPDAAIFGAALLQGKSVAQAFTAAQQTGAEFDPVQTFQRLVVAGAFVRVITQGEQS